MLKVFISVPTAGRDDKDIISSVNMLKALGDVVIPELHTYVEMPKIDTEVLGMSDRKKDMYVLSKRIELLSQCDVFISVCRSERPFSDEPFVWENTNVRLEKDIASSYGVNCYMFDIDIVCPDLMPPGYIPIKYIERPHICGDTLCGDTDGDNDE